MSHARYYNNSRLEFLKLYKEFSPQASQATIDTFDSSIKRIEKLYGKRLEQLKLSFINDPSDICDRFKKTTYSRNTLYCTINAINKLCIIIDSPLKIKQAWSIKVREMTLERDNKTADNIKSKNESTNWIDYNDLLEKVNEKYDELMELLSDGEIVKFLDFRNFMILCLYTFMPPARIGNYLNCEVIRKHQPQLESTHNYLIVKNLTTDPTFYFVWNKYKTARTLGTQIHKVESDKLSNLLHIYFTKYNIEEKWFLVQNINTNPMELSQSNLTNILKKESHSICDKFLSVDMLRHIFISNLMKNNVSIKNKLEIAGIMGQQFKPNQLDQYNKID